MSTIVEARGLKMYFPVGRTLGGKPKRLLKAVDDVSFSIQKGETFGLVGESGCGKTTVGRCLVRLYEPTDGRIFFDGQDIAHLGEKPLTPYRRRMQMIFQDPYASLNPRMTVASIIAEPLRYAGASKAYQTERVRELVDLVGLKPDHLQRYPHEFSGGQRQRVGIARALACNPEFIVCDEPVSALDVSIQAQIINLLNELQDKYKLTYLFISHDLSVVEHISDTVGVMYLGNLVEYGAKEDIFRNPLHPYTKALFSAIPIPDPKVKMNRIVLEGSIPSPANPPKGCKFHTRCSECMNVCRMVEPSYHEVSKGHFVACHLYDSEIMSKLDYYDVEYARLEAEAARKAEEEERSKAERRAKNPFIKAWDKTKSLFKKKDKSADETNTVAAEGKQSSEEPKSGD